MSTRSAIGPPLHEPSTGLSDRFSKTLLAKALQSGRDRRAGRAQRTDGWTPDRIRTFLEVLARTGAATKAARAAGMSRQSAYALRASAKGQTFDDAWRRALLLAAPNIPDELMDRAINGWVEPVYRKGKLWGERHRFDNRLTLRVLKHLDRMASSQSPAARVRRAVAEDFEAFVDVVCTGDEELADAFLRSRCSAHRSAQRTAQSPKLSTLPDPAQAESQNPSTLPGAGGAESADLSTLPAAPLWESWTAGIVSSLEKAA